ncbi:hypothetical protein NXS98_08400 [Fontisphaera persica]|uniref:hypothetical protein n=1 Tax=Fontisphaera persica TaxID=2974023 RepID=UPI0024C0C79D|nr:hypothetical protein [Fontisphaera persica]WCJ61128.1 hypothetical protein NXS98_08400 [Fontisphaera persica]
MINSIEKVVDKHGVLLLLLLLVSGGYGAAQGAQTNKKDGKIWSECIVYEGTLNIISYDIENRLKMWNDVYKYKVIVGSPEWKIAVDYSEATKDIDQEEVSWDGQYLYKKITMVVHASSTNLISRQRYTNILIKPWEVPYNYTRVYLLWFALASTHYLHQQNTNVLNIPPFWVPVTSTNEAAFYTLIKKYAPDSRLPDEADVYIIKEKERKDHEQHIGGGQALMPNEKVFQDKYKYAEYRVFEYYQEDGKYIHPKRFGLRTYAVTRRNDPNSSLSRSYMRSLYIANITNAYKSNYSAWVPNMDGTVFVTDYRLKSKGSKDIRVGYHITNGIIPDTNHPLVLEALRRSERADAWRTRNLESIAAFKKKQQHKYMVLFAVLALVPMVAYGWVTAAKQKKTNNRRVGDENSR